MAFTVQLGTVDKRINDLSRVEMADVITEMAVLKEPTSVVSPTVILQLAEHTLDQIVFKNYMQIAVFRRLYWIRNVRIITSTVVEIDCEVDALASWRDEIMQNEAFILYSDSEYNSMLSDSRLQKSCRSETTIKSIHLDGTSEKGSYIITIASSEVSGKNGLVESFVFQAEELNDITSKVYGTDFFSMLASTRYNPSESIASCIWLPIPKAKISDGESTISFGQYQIGRGSIAKTNIVANYNLDIPMKYHDEKTNTCADYRNCEPYTEYSIYLPGVGIVELPMIAIITKADSRIIRIKISMSISVLTGDVNYIIMNKEDRILSVHGNIAVNIPVPNSSTGMRETISGGLQIASSAIAGSAVPAFAPFAAGMALQGASSVIMSIGQRTYSASGSVSGWLDYDLELSSITVLIRNYDVSDDCANASSVIGRPLYKKMKIQNLKGFTQTGVANIKASATLEELQTINNLMNGGVYIG